MSVIEFDESKDDFDKVIADNKDKPTFVDFNASWCGPCKALKPVIEKLCKDNGFVLVAVDTDNNPELSEKFEIQGIPNVHLYLKGKHVDQFVGSNQEKLNEFVKKAKESK